MEFFAKIVIAFGCQLFSQKKLHRRYSTGLKIRFWLSKTRSVLRKTTRLVPIHHSFTLIKPLDVIFEWKSNIWSCLDKYWLKVSDFIIFIVKLPADFTSCFSVFVVDLRMLFFSSVAKVLKLLQSSYKLDVSWRFILRFMSRGITVWKYKIMFCRKD